jgi:hypothetical protein
MGMPDRFPARSPKYGVGLRMPHPNFILYFDLGSRHDWRILFILVFYINPLLFLFFRFNTLILHLNHPCPHCRYCSFSELYVSHPMYSPFVFGSAATYLPT